MMQVKSNSSLISTKIVEGIDAIKLIAKEWDAAIPQSFTAALGQSAWHFAYQAAFPTPRFVLILARKDQQIVGILPLSLEKSDARGLFFSQVTTFARGDYQPPIVKRELAEEVVPILIDAAIRHFGRRYVYRWTGIPASDPSAKILPSYFAARGISYVTHTDIAPRLNIKGRSYSEIESSWSKSHRTDVRRQRKRLGEKGPLQLVQPQSFEEAIILLREFFDVHDEKWLAQGQPGRFRDPAERKHFESIAQLMLGRGAMLSALRCGDTNVSYAFGFFSDNWVQWYRPSYRTEFENFSPGKVHISLMLELACQNGWQGIDFLLGTEGYKYQWSDEKLEVHDFYSSCRSWSPAYFWFTQGKPFVRQKIGHLYASAQALIQKKKAS